ncbi:acyl-CoA synthetase [Vineibacter terrae]|uniref:acyl-CoA synthetase n=1 Tax=Vineibacter terrae TaxID=2586908 RepID=UPI002E377720|nr:acyl-CoA synthetase [Vineibacter terrae]HEX2891728.1 acyl-CoA synthetase [Vineibacter terrae]
MDGHILSGTRELKQATLLERGARAASGFASLGIGEDGAVAMVLRNDFAFFEAAIGASLVGAYAVPVNWHFKADEAGYIVRDCGAKAVVVHADLLPQIKDGIPADVSVFVVPTPPEVREAYGIDAAACAVPPDATAWDDWVARQPVWTEPPRATRSNMIYTSGTTGRPKGVRRQPAGPELQAVATERLAYVFGVRPGTGVRTVVTGPIYHSAPNAYALAAARDGELVVLQPRFDSEELLRLIEQHRITHLHMVPTMFVRLLKLPPEVRRKYDLSSLQFVVHAAAPCPPDVKRQMIEWWGPVINEYYGGTETGAVVFHSSEEALKKPGTVGRPVPGGTVKIFDVAGKELGPGEIGEVYLKLDGFPDFTYNRMDDKRREVDRQGLVTCGDVGYVDEDGYLFLCDRVRDMVISGGVNIYPAEIESVLIGMPGVQDCAVFGIPDDEYGESLAAYVEPQEGAGLTADAVRTFLRERTAGYKVPKLIKFEHGLPREDSGKIFKRKLRAPYWEKAGRQI